jgi:hypothetical protein
MYNLFLFNFAMFLTDWTLQFLVWSFFILIDFPYFNFRYCELFISLVCKHVFAFFDFYIKTRIIWQRFATTFAVKWFICYQLIKAKTKSSIAADYLLPLTFVGEIALLG